MSLYVQVQPETGQDPRYNVGFGYDDSVLPAKSNMWGSVEPDQGTGRRSSSVPRQPARSAAQDPEDNHEAWISPAEVALPDDPWSASQLGFDYTNGAPAAGQEMLMSQPRLLKQTIHRDLGGEARQDFDYKVPLVETFIDEPGPWKPVQPGLVQNVLQQTSQSRGGSVQMPNYGTQTPGGTVQMPNYGTQMQMQGGSVPPWQMPNYGTQTPGGSVQMPIYGQMPNYSNYLSQGGSVQLPLASAHQVLS